MNNKTKNTVTKKAHLIGGVPSTIWTSFCLLCMLLASQFLLDAKASTDVDSPFIMVKSIYSLEETVDTIKDAVIDHNLKIVREQNLDYGFVEETVENDRQRTLYLCNIDLLHQALSQDKRIGIMLPCQINVIERADGTYVIAPNPKAISSVFLEDMNIIEPCNNFANTYREILDQVKS